jgi:hypothetical protein
MDVVMDGKTRKLRVFLDKKSLRPAESWEVTCPQRFNNKKYILSAEYLLIIAHFLSSLLMKLF